MRVLLLRRYRKVTECWLTPSRFVNSVIRKFNEKYNDNTKDDYIIPLDFFDVAKPLVLAEIPYCPRNETLSKRFIKKFHEFTNNSYEIRIKWITKKVKQLFKLKSKNPHPSCVIYEGVCVCEQTYIGETRRNVNCDGKNMRIPPKIPNPQNTWKKT